MPALEPRAVRTLASFPTTEESAGAEVHTSSVRTTGKKGEKQQQQSLFRFEHT